MEFNVLKYAELLNKFIMDMEPITTNDNPDINTAITPIARLLGISVIRVGFFDNIVAESEKNGYYEDAYVDGEADENKMLFMHEVTRGGNVVTYSVYGYKNADDWNDTVTDAIKTLIKLLFVFNGRNRVMSTVDFLTYHDRELGIFNLPYFMRFGTDKIAEGSIGKYAACYFNLKRFSAVNQQIGRELATRCMIEYTEGINSMLSSDEIVCRIGGDNFVILCFSEHLGDILDYLKGKEIIYDEINGEGILITASAGVYLVPDGCKSVADIMDCVSIANSMARNVLKQPYVYYNDELLARIKEAKTIENMFPEAIKNEEFRVYYQPKVSLKDYSLVGAEALCRWAHNGEIMSPNLFIPVLEQSKDICTLDFYMLEHVCRDLRRWLDEGRKVVKVSVNLSRCHMDDYNLLDHLLEIIDKYNVPHEYIEFELTETTTDVDFMDLKRIVFGLQEAGISTSVDDFGMGYSSLNLIGQLPWKVIKIDKSFLYGDRDNFKHNQVMLKHVISMAQEMGMQCIVEGVETIEQVCFLKENNCFVAQGFYFDKPLPKNDFMQRLEAIQ